LTSDDEKIKHLKERLAGYYVNSLQDITHPFIGCIMTCVGIEVIGQVILGFNAKGGSIDNNTLDVYKMLDPIISQSPSSTFKTNYNRNRNVVGTVFTDFAQDLPTYADLIRKGLRNSYTHNYRSLGVMLRDSQKDLVVEEAAEGILVVNPDMFRNSFIALYETCFSDMLAGHKPLYKAKAIEYINLLLK
jgi:hypothetical protein